MDELVLYYLGQCLLSWGVGFCGGLLHRSFVQLMEKAAMQ